MTCTEIEENTATALSAFPMKGMVQINQGFHLSVSEGGGTNLKDHASFTAPRILARIVRSQAHASHSAILANTRKHFMELSQKASS